MIDTPHVCVDSPWPDTSSVTYSEYESGFLLPQLMGALASESAGLATTGVCRWRGSGALFLKMGASLMQALRLRLC